MHRGMPVKEKVLVSFYGRGRVGANGLQVYTMVQHVIYNHTNLLYNRHLDQILLSALYGVCKVSTTISWSTRTSSPPLWH